MPVTQWVEKNRRRVCADGWDPITLSDIRTAIDAALGDPEYESGFGVLVDFSRITVPLTARQVRGIATHLKRAGSAVVAARCAVVVCTPASYGMTRMLGMLVERVPITIVGFETTAEAESWLLQP